MIRAAAVARAARTSGIVGPGAPAGALPSLGGRHLFRVRLGLLEYRPVDVRHAPGARAYALRALLRARVPEAIGSLLIPVELSEHLWSPALADAIGRAVRRAMAGEAA